MKKAAKGQAKTRKIAGRRPAGWTVRKTWRALKTQLPMGCDSCGCGGCK